MQKRFRIKNQVVRDSIARTMRIRRNLAIEWGEPVIESRHELQEALFNMKLVAATYEGILTGKGYDPNNIPVKMEDYQHGCHGIL